MLNRGSQWNRWDPHIHSPDTVLNDQFKGDDAWSQYLDALEATDPPIQAIGLTDYYLTTNYETVCAFKDCGRLPKVQFIFPNIEMRLAVSGRSGFINIHLLVDPQDPDHIHQLSRVLARLSFSAFEDEFHCTQDDLVRLGKRADPGIQSDRAALQKGVTQFKVSFDELRRVFRDSGWAKANILVAVSGGRDDGTSGLRERAEATLRQEIERFAHIIFSSSSAQREFWLGEGVVDADTLRSRYGDLKPCLHGSDAHSVQEVGRPAEDRYSWIKGALEFDSLRQACIDPAARAYVGPKPPPATTPSRVISTLTVENAQWMETTHIPLNSGLVAVIGARGTGKTALAETVAAGCDAIPGAVWDGNDTLTSSFFARAREHLGDGTVVLNWAGGEQVSRHLDGRDANGTVSFERARYLSQKFVEDLCSANGPTDGLIEEIERVVFEAHPIDERDGALNFADLREMRTRRCLQARARETDAILTISKRISEELEKEHLVESLEAQVALNTNQIDGYKADLGNLVVKGFDDDAKLKRHQELRLAVQARRKELERYKEQHRTFERLQDEVAGVRKTVAPDMLRESKMRHLKSDMTPEQWDDFLLDYKGPVDDKLRDYIRRASRAITDLAGSPPEKTSDGTPYVPETADLAQVELATLDAEITRLEGELNADTLVRDQYSTLSRRITDETTVLQTLQDRLEDARGAADRRRDLQQKWEAAYERALDAILAEQHELAELYAPMKLRLQHSEGTLKKLDFSVFRAVDAIEWARYAEEELLDLRLEGPFRGQGTLTDKISEELRPAWKAASANQATRALSDFWSTYLEDFLAHASHRRDQQEAFRTWLGKFCQWISRTDHISVRYGITYDGVDIEKLSPGTRGIVLLLIYLALDDADDRPLIIDQPEENLDTRSVFRELVPLFKTAKTKRQVLIVTHNANLVVNTDADQIIIAEASPPHMAGELPRLTYRGGGQESADIRHAVCEILEGGKDALRDRARRLRVQLER